MKGADEACAAVVARVALSATRGCGSVYLVSKVVELLQLSGLKELDHLVSLALEAVHIRSASTFDGARIVRPGTNYHDLLVVADSDGTAEPAKGNVLP